MGTLRLNHNRRSHCFVIVIQISEHSSWKKYCNSLFHCFSNEKLLKSLDLIILPLFLSYMYVWTGSYPFFIVIRCVQFLVNSQVYAQCCPLMFESLNSDIAHKVKVGLPTSDFSLLPCLKTCIKNTFLNCYDDNTFCQRLSPVFFTRPIADRSMDTKAVPPSKTKGKCAGNTPITLILANRTRNCDMCRFCVLLMHRDVGGVRQHTA